MVKLAAVTNALASRVSVLETNMVDTANSVTEGLEKNKELDKRTGALEAQSVVDSENIVKLTEHCKELEDRLGDVEAKSLGLEEKLENNIGPNPEKTMAGTQRETKYLILKGIWLRKLMKES